MLKSFILLSLIYLISSKLDCNSDELADNSNACFNRVVAKDKHCCYEKVSTSSGSIGRCYEYSKDISLDDLRKGLAEYYAKEGYKLEDVFCPINEDSTKEDDKNFCINNNKAPNQSNDCFNRNLVDKENNTCCFMKLSSKSESQNICYEFPIANLDKTKENLTKQLAEYSITLEELNCQKNKEDDSPKKYACNDESAVKNKTECFIRTLSNKNDTHCCYYKISGLFGTFTGCSEFPKAYGEEYLRNIVNKQYAESNINLEELSCPGNGEDEDSIKGDKNLCDADKYEPKNHIDCFKKSLADEKNNHCCYIKLLKGNETNSLCKEYPTNTSLYDIKQSLLKDYLISNITVGYVSCPKSENDSSHGNSCSDYIAPKDDKECFNRSTGQNNLCCYVSLKGKSSNFSVCDEYPKSKNENDIRQSINEQYSPLGYSVETLSCPKIVEDQPNQPPQDAASKGLYIKSGVLLIVSFLF